MSDASSVPCTSGIYKIICAVNGKIYVGSAQNLRVRWNDHRSSLRNNRHPNIYLQRAWNKYGESAFEFEIIELVMPWSRIDREQYWLDKLKPYNRKNGFNIAQDAQTPAHTPESRKKMSESAKLKSPMSDETKRKLSEAGKRRTPEHIQSLLAAHLGTRRSEETCRKISEANKGRQYSDETLSKLREASRGKRHSEETRLKMSESAKLRWAQKKLNNE